MNRLRLLNRRPLRRPTLTFAPLAWLKLQYFCHLGETEIGGFGITAAGHPLYVEDFVTIPQLTSLVTVRFRDDAVADYFDHCVDQGLAPEQFARIWVHTHPGRSVTPSATDEDTFARVFGHCDWAVMAILGRTSRTYARLAMRTGPRVDIEIPTRVDWAGWPDALADDDVPFDLIRADWENEFVTNIEPELNNSRILPWSNDPFAAVASPATADWKCSSNLTIQPEGKQNVPPD